MSHLTVPYLDPRSIPRRTLTRRCQIRKPTYEAAPNPWEQAASPDPLPVVVVGAGMTGLTFAIDLAQRGIPCVLLDGNHMSSTGSRSISHLKRSLEIWNRLGIGEHLLQEGLLLNSGHVYPDCSRLLKVDLQPALSERFPTFISLPQWRVEALLLNRARRSPMIDLRWESQVVGLVRESDSVILEVKTPAGLCAIRARWVVGADGVQSSVRELLGARFEGSLSGSRFLIVDVRLGIDLPPECHFWFTPPFHDGKCVLMRRQRNGVWRLDCEIAVNADPEVERAPGSVLMRLIRMFGDDTAVEIEWVGVYDFEVRRTASFRHGRILLVGDAAHQSAPFGGGRAGNSGVQDADNLGWKLAAVIEGSAAPTLLDTYCAEREAAADENMLISRRSSRFIVPDSPAAMALRNSVRHFCGRAGYIDRFVNIGRLSTPSRLPSNTVEAITYSTRATPRLLGSVILDAPVAGDRGERWLSELIGDSFMLLVACDRAVTAQKAQHVLDGLRARRSCRWSLLCVGAAASELGVAGGLRSAKDPTGLLRERYSLYDASWYLVRPDAYVIGRGQHLDTDAICSALDQNTRSSFLTSEALHDVIALGALPS